MKKLLAAVVLLALLLLSWSVVLTPERVPDHSAEIQRYLEAARTQAELGAYGSALDHLNAALALGESLETRLLLADTYLQSGDRNQYQQQLKTAVSLWPGDPRAYEKLSEAYFQGGNYTSCKELCLQAKENGCMTEVLEERYYLSAFHTTIASVPFAWAGSFFDGLALVQMESGEYYYINEKMSGALGPFKDATAARSGVLGVTENGKAGFLDRNGNRYMDSRTAYEKTYTLSDGRALVRRDGAWYFVDSAFRELLGPYEDASVFSGGTAAVLENGVWRLIDTAGRQRGEATFTKVLMDEDRICSSMGVVFASTGNGYDLYRADGTLIAAAGFPDARPFSAGDWAAFYDGRAWGFVDVNGNVVIEPAYEDARSASGGLAAVRVNGAWGFIASNGRMVVEPVYEDAGCFRGGAPAPVCLDGKWYYLERK